MWNLLSYFRTQYSYPRNASKVPDANVLIHCGTGGLPVLSPNHITFNEDDHFWPNIIKAISHIAQRLKWVWISLPSCSRVIWITWPPRQLSTEFQLLTFYNETATKVTYQLKQEARSITNEAVQFLHFTQEQKCNNRAEKKDWQHRLICAKIQKY